MKKLAVAADYVVGPRGETQRVIDHSGDPLTPEVPAA